MYKQQFLQRRVPVFKHFARKGYALFAALGKEVLIGVLGVATLTTASAKAGVTANAVPDKSIDSLALRGEGSIDIGEVVVTASRAPLTLAQQTRMVTVLTREDIQAAPVQSVNDLLKYAAGVDIRQRGALGAQTDVSIRGGNSDQVAILLNGISISDPQTGHNAFDFPVSIEDIERIEVLEGPASLVYGTSSLLGAINIVTKTGVANGKALSAHLEGGSFGYLSAGVRGALLAGTRWEHSLSGSYTRSDGFSRSKSGHLNTDYKTGKAFYQGLYSDDDILVRWHAGLSSKGWGSSTFYSKNFDNQYEHSFKSFTALQAETRRGFIRLRPAVYWNHQYDRFELLRGDDAVTGKVPFNYHRADIYGVNINGWFDWLLGRTAVGAELRNEDLVSTNLGEALHEPKHIHGTDRNYVKGLNRTNVQFVLEHNVLLDRFSLSAGLVAVKNSWADMPVKVYPSADLSYRIANGWKVYASYNSSLRMPSVTELYYSVGGHQADSHLKPEELNAVEIGFKYRSNSGITASANGFYNHYKNLIDWIQDGTTDENGLVSKSVNFGKINAWGAEASLALDFHRLFPAQRFLRSLSTNYCYLFQDHDVPANITSTYALEYLRHKWVTSLGLDIWSRLSLDISYRLHHRMGDYYDTNAQRRRYGTYGILDAKLQWQEPKWTAYVEGNNLLDKDYEEVGNVPQPGIWVIGGVSIRL